MKIVGKVERNEKGRMIQMMDREIVLECEKKYTPQKMAQICGATPTTIGRWKERGRADAEKIKPLLSLLNIIKPDDAEITHHGGKQGEHFENALQSAPMEELLKEIKRRGFNLTLTIEDQ